MTSQTTQGGAAPPASPEGDPAAATTGELVTRLSTQLSELIRGEMALARAELTEKGKRVGAGAGLAGAAGVVALYGVGALVAAGVAALALVAGRLARRRHRRGGPAPGRRGARTRGPQPDPAGHPARAGAGGRGHQARRRDRQGGDPAMTAAQEPRPAGTPEDRTPAELREDLAGLRTDLGDTVEELANRVDVPAACARSATRRPRSCSTRSSGPAASWPSGHRPSRRSSAGGPWSWGPSPCSRRCSWCAGSGAGPGPDASHTGCAPQTP